ncbi:MAG: DNA helicase RecQ [Bacteroides sp.]|nr:DNA helicase RecQ [Bacteroides sp.]
MTDKLSVLKKYYGYSSFRPGQEEIIDNTLSGRDSVVLMPTGGGKSLCYQIPALIMPGCAIVVSPLIALMIDQVQPLQANGIPAAAIHSNQDEHDNQDILYQAIQGKIKMIYISPERLMIEMPLIAERVNVSFVAIDEAHCISQWGHDFRPVYTNLKVIKQMLPGVAIMALTATADRLTRSDIAAALSLNNPFMWIGSFDRPNISLSVLSDPGKKNRLRIISSLIQKYHMDSGIVYCLSRKKTEEMHKALAELGYKSICYHAGLPPQIREEAQKAFVNGEVQVVCATIAFGMGIDKSNIRWVVHNNIPGNIESYYQEIGRAGRDGLPAEAILFYNFADIITRRSFVEDSGQREINEEKLDLMQRYAEASVCRRRILLSYFSEERNCDCGNCDNCRNPRKKIDGTIYAQKALSAIVRINASEGMHTIIDILRASTRAEIIQKGYHKIKTYGAGRELYPMEWNSYMLQMIQLGLIEVAYEDNFHLRPTEYGMKVLRGQERIMLSAYEPQKYGSNRKKSETISKPRLTPDEQLMENLKVMRKEISQKRGIADYMIFSDATLTDMVKRRPKTIDEMSRISGVSELKLAAYGKDFLGVVRKFLGLSRTEIGTSQKESLILFNSGMTPEEIAKIKNVTVSTVYGHLTLWIDDDKLTDFRRLVSSKDYNTILNEFTKDPENAYVNLKETYSIPPHIIRAAQAERRWHNRNSNDLK